MRPYAVNHGVAREVDSPMIASGPRTWTIGHWRSAAVGLGPLPARIRRAQVAEHLGEQRDPGGDVGVVVARDAGDVLGPHGQLGELRAGELELLAQREVRDVAGAQDVIDLLRVEIRDHVVERGHVIVAAPVRQQVHRADPALVREIEPPRPVVRQQVEIGAVREPHPREIARHAA